MIKVLDKNVAELIAAGEVIERPASIIKELLENSIDALATMITVDIKNGGISYIKITDNGCGIAKTDVAVAFLRHATSKVSSVTDLDNINTLGFRGEALASISAVSNIELITKTKDATFGTKVAFNDGIQSAIEEVGCPCGTTIIVKDLFYNVPARLKFLKSYSTETSAIAAIVDKISLSHPEISFKFVTDNKIKLHTSGAGDLLSAIHSVFSSDFANSLIPVNYKNENINIVGYISKCEQARANRNMQLFFVNSRYVKSKTCVTALEEGYKSSIMVGKYPACVLNIVVQSNSIDINVHPAKLEIRFSNERAIFDALYFAIKTAISAEVIQVKTPNITSTFKDTELKQTILPNNDNFNFLKAKNFIQTSTTPIQMNDNVISNNILPTLSQSKNAILNGEFKAPIIELEQNNTDEAYNDNNYISQDSYIIIGELLNTYILCETLDGLVIIDKHAAHERIVYERLKSEIMTRQMQLLLKPIIVTVSNDEHRIILENDNIFKDMGFLVEDFGDNAVAVREVPLILALEEITTMVLDIANKLLELKVSITADIFDDLLHSIACRTAIKANDKSSMPEINELALMVFADTNIRHCPHGRPIIVSITKKEIEKKFGRIV